MWHKYKILAWREKIEQLKQGIMPVPCFASLHLSYLCNQHCKNCAHGESNASNFIMEEHNALGVVNELMDYGIKTFEFGGGGEPTMLPYLENLIKHIVGRGGEYSLMTNGVNLSDSLIELLAKTATYVRVSLETGDKELYLKYKKVPAWHFDKVIENIKKLIEKKAPDTDINLKFDVGEMFDTKEHLESSFLLAKELNVDLAVFRSFTYPDNLTTEKQLELSHYLDEILEMDLHIGKPAIANNIYYDTETDNFKCWLNPLHTLVDAYGDIYICCYYYQGHNKDNHKLGNLTEHSFKEIWEGEGHKEKVKNIDGSLCSQFGCRFVGHHKIVDEVMKRGRLNII
jgi:MoaA/NifB/PqqE/SkfB family radical SAM enzyme